MVKVVYSYITKGDASAEKMVAECVRTWSAWEGTDKHESSVAHCLDVELIQEPRLPVVCRIAECLDYLGVTIGKEQNGAFVCRNSKKGQIIRNILTFWESHVPLNTIKGFIGRYFSEIQKVKLSNFVTYWSPELVSDLETDEAKELSSFIFPDIPLSTSGSAAKRTLTNGLLVPVDAEIKPDPLQVPDDQISISLVDFKDHGTKKKRSSKLPAMAKKAMKEKE